MKYLKYKIFFLRPNGEHSITHLSQSNCGGITNTQQVLQARLLFRCSLTLQVYGIEIGQLLRHLPRQWL